MKTINDFIDSIFNVEETDQTDPLTLTNLILHKDIRRGGYNWVKPFDQVTIPSILAVPGGQPPPGDYIREAKEKKKNEKAKEDGNQANAAVPQQVNDPNAPQAIGGQQEQPGQQPEQPIQTADGQIVNLERNKQDPNLVSSMPQFNNCPAFFMKDNQSAPICRVTNRVCIYLNSDYKQCGVYNTASTGDPNTFELPPGKENTYAYLMGLKF